MEEIIIEYLNNNYSFTLSTYVNFLLLDRNTKEVVSVAVVLNSLKPIFGIDDDMMHKCFDTWVDARELDFHNKLIDLNYKIYQKTGIDLGVNNLDTLMALEGDRLSMLMDEMRVLEETT